MIKVLGRSLDRRERQVIELRLMQAHDMFEMPSTDLFSEYRNFLTGVDICLSELRSRRSVRPVRLEIRMPPEAIDDGVADRLAGTLRRYCNHRIHYNRRESQAQRVGGVSALRIGIPDLRSGTGARRAGDEDQARWRCCQSRDGPSRVGTGVDRVVVPS